MDDMKDRNQNGLSEDKERDRSQMMAIYATRSFAYDFFSRVDGLLPKSIEIMIKNGYDSLYSLLAIDLDKDLDKIKDINLGQKSIIRAAIRHFINNYNFDNIDVVNNDTNEVVSDDNNDAVNDDTNDAVNDNTNDAVNDNTNDAVNDDTNDAVNDNTNDAVNNDTNDVVNDDTNEVVSDDNNEVNNDDTNDAVNDDTNDVFKGKKVGHDATLEFKSLVTHNNYK